MKNESKIPGGSDYWGRYNGYDIYRYYGKQIPVTGDMVFAKDGELWLKGVVIGHVTSSGNVLDWDPKKADNPRPKKSDKREPIMESAPKGLSASEVEGGYEVDTIIDCSWKRSIDELVGERLADYSDNKYSL